jgi:hypothetical protein
VPVLLNQETIKPRNLGETLVRLGKYFGQYWYMIVLAVLFVVISTWTQVTTPELMGQATDCFLVPAGPRREASLHSSLRLIQQPKPLHPPVTSPRMTPLR